MIDTNELDTNELDESVEITPGDIIFMGDELLEKVDESLVTGETVGKSPRHLITIRKK